MKGGLILEHVKPKDYTQERLYGSADRTEKIVQLGRDVTAVPQIYQGDKPFCVAATITWIKQFMSGNVDLAHEYLAMIAKIGNNGARPSQVLEPARKRGIASQKAWNRAKSDADKLLEESAEEFKIAGYTRVTDLSAHGLYTALKRSPLAVGVSDWKGVGPHFMAVYDVTADGLACKARNWWEGSEEEIIPFDKIVCAYGFLSPEFAKPSHPINAGWASAITSFLALNKKILGIGGIILASLLAFLNPIGFGAGYTPVTGYESTFTARVTSSDATFPVASINDKAGHAIVFANTSPSSTARIYFTLEPGGTREEVSYCTGVSGSSFTGCVRGLDFQGGSLTASSTLAKIHPAGSKIIISNVGQVYGEFVSIDGTQRIDGQKYFAVIPRQTATTTLPTEDDQYATKGYVDQVGAGGFTSANASTTMGVIVNGTSPETFGVRLSSLTSGLWFDTGNSYALSLKTSSTKGLYVDSLGNVAVDESDNFVWSGTHIFSGNVTSYGTLRVLSPTSSLDAVNRGYLDEQVFGDGSDGSITLGSGTTTLNTAGKYVYQYTDVSVTGTAELTIGSNLYGSCVTVLVQNDLTITSSFASSVNLYMTGATSSYGGAINTAGGAGALGDSYLFATAAGGGSHDGYGRGGGGGGGFGNNGVVGGTKDGTPGGTAGGGERYDESYTISRLIGIGHVGAGGGGGAGGDVGIGGNGGRGGGCMIFVVGGDINLTGAMTVAGAVGSAGGADGGGGSPGAGGGGGGGGGGFLGFFYGGTSSTTSVFTVSGGAGGAGGTGSNVGAAGGAGGAGRVIIRSLKSWLGI